MKKILLVILVAIGITIALFFLFNAEKIFKYFGPFETTIFTVKTDIKKEYTDFEFGLDFLSNIPFRFFVEKMHYTVSFDSTQFSEGTKFFNRQFSRGDRDTLVLPLRMKMDPLKRKIKSLETADSTTLYIDLIAYVKLPITGITDIHINIDKRIPSPRPPEIKVNNIEIDQFAFKDMELLLNMDIINQNSIALVIKEATLRIDFPELFKGKIQFPDSFKIEAKDRTNLNARVITEDLELIRDGLSILFNHNKRSYNLTGNMKIASPKDPQNIINLSIHNEGETHLMKRRIENQKQE